MNSDLLYDASISTPHTCEKSHPSMCTHHMLLRSTQGGCRYVTTHRSSSVRVHMKHRAGRRNQLAFSGAALLCTHRAKVHSASWTRFSREIGKVRDVYTRGLLPVAVSIDISPYEYWCCWCCCTFRLVPYDPSLVVASFVASHSRSCC